VTRSNPGPISLNYGTEGRFSCEIDAARVVASRIGPRAVSQLGDEIARSLAHPVAFPPLVQAVISDDHVVLALDRYTPQAASLVAAVWVVLEDREVDPARVTVLQPVPLNGTPLPDPRSELPEHARQAMAWKTHDPTSDLCAYLAATSSGERIYLARELIDADIVITLGSIEYDSVLGYRGTNSVFYPGLSNADAVAKAHGQGHRELGPDDTRPLRQLIDEIGWLLGTQFTLQVIPSTGTDVAGVVAGTYDSVLQEGKQALAEGWLVELDRRADIVVAAVDVDARGHGWTQVGAALATARNLVAREGKIILLSELDEELGAGLELLAEADAPRDASPQLRAQSPADLVGATQCIEAVDWADVYLLSELPSDLVEDLFMIPLTNDKEVLRLLESGGTCAFVGSAQHAHGQLRQD